MKKMLINALQSEELRVAIVEAHNQNLLDIIVDRQSYRTKTGNIYLGEIRSVEPSLDAVFVHFGSDRHGFLPLKEISKEYFDRTHSDKQERGNIKDLIKEGQYVMVQVEKEERGNKGAALTTFISLAGSYLVLMPNNPRAGGISRRVEGEDRDELREILSGLPLPEGMGIIVRTAGVGKSAEELEWDLKNLLRQWEAIKQASTDRNPPFLIHQESDLVTRIIRDYLRDDFVEILIDDIELHDKVKKHLEQVRPIFVERVKHYTNKAPIFSHYQIEQKIESAYLREVRLPSGGSIVIDHTEALVAIDVNSARSTKGSDIEDTALKTNMEAAEEIARQLRLRDIGGLIVIDFIDMSSMRNRREVENHLRNSLKLDKARTQIGNVSSRFGLLEMSRQRLRHSLGEATQVVCTRCSGWGTIRGIESLGLSIIRIIEEEAVKAQTAQVQAQIPVDVATFLINEKRELISHIEKNHGVEIFIIPNLSLESPHYHVKRLTQSELPRGTKSKSSYTLIEKIDIDTPYKKTELHNREEKPAVSTLLPDQPAPTKKPSSSIIKRLIAGLFGTSDEQTTIEPVRPTPPPPKAEPHRPPHHPKHKNPRYSNPREKKTPHPGHPRNKHPHPPKDKPPVHAPAPAPMPVPVPVPKEEPVAHISPDSPEKHKNPDLKSRTRRGTRGGRRRSNPTHQNKKPGESVHLNETPQDTSPPSYLPPFPTDLEEYYKENLSHNKKAPPKSDETAIKQDPVVKHDPASQPKNISEPTASTQAQKIEPAPSVKVTNPGSDPVTNVVTQSEKHKDLPTVVEPKKENKESEE